MLPNKQQSRNGRLLPGRKCGQVPKQRGGDSNAGVLHLPPLVESTKMLMTSQLRHATRELRTQVMWQTGSPPGLRGQTENLGTGEMGDTLDALLDTHILHGEETLGSSYQVNTVKPPWYSVSLTLKQLQRHVCLSNMSLFGRLTSGEWSTASNCSSNVIAPVPKRDEKQKTKSKTVTHVQQIMTSVSEVRSESLTQPTEPNVGVSLSRRGIPHKNFVLALRQWQGGVQRELRGATANLDPVELHEKHMQIVLKEENAVRLVGHLEKHQKLQEQERRKEMRLREEVSNKFTEARGRVDESERWRTFLTTWTREQTRVAEKGCGGVSLCDSAVERPSMQTRVPALVTPFFTSGRDKMPNDSVAHPFARQSSVPTHLRSVTAIRSDLVVTLHESKKDASRGGAQCAFDPFNELQKLLLIVGGYSQQETSLTKTRKENSEVEALRLKFEKSHQSTLFPPPTALYMRGDWVECVLRGNDLPWLREFTRSLCTHVASRELTSSFSRLSLSEAHPLDGSRKICQLQKLEAWNTEFQACESAVGSARSDFSTVMLIPFRLAFKGYDGRVKIVTVDAVDLVKVQKKHETQPCEQCHSHGDMTGKRDVLKIDTSSVAAGDVAVSLGLCACLVNSAHVDGALPLKHDALVCYNVDTLTVAKQSMWRAATMKQLANEENTQLQRSILAKVVVSLAMNSAISMTEGLWRSRCRQGSLSVSKASTRKCSVISYCMGSSRYSSTLMGARTNNEICSDICSDDTIADVAPLLFGQSKSLSQFNIFEAPERREYYVIDVNQLFVVAASALEESNTVILPSLQRLTAHYQRLIIHLTEATEMNWETATDGCHSFTPSDASLVSSKLADSLELLQLEAKYSEHLSTLVRNECVINYYNLHHRTYSKFMHHQKQTWGWIYLRTLRLSYAFCIVIQEIGTLPIPQKYRPFLGPVLQFICCYGGQMELRSTTAERMLELEMRSNRVGMPLYHKDVPAYRKELDAVADAVAEGCAKPERIISCLASPDDVLITIPEVLNKPQKLFTEVSCIAR